VPYEQAYAHGTVTRPKPAGACADRKYRRHERFLAGALAATALVPLPGLPSVTAALAAFVLFWPILRFSRFSETSKRIFAACAAVAISSGSLALCFGRYPPSLQALMTLAFLSTSAAVLFWCAEVLGARATLVLAPLMPALFDLATRPVAGNPWKYALSVWAVLAAFAWVSDRKLPQRLVVYAILVAISATYDTRNIIALIGFAAVYEISSSAATRRWQVATWSLLGVIASTLVGVQLVLAGALGTNIEQTTRAQMREGPLSILSYARPEFTGNFSIVTSDPWRVDLDPRLSSQYASVIRQSFSDVDKDPNSMYVRQNVIAQRELHSVGADLWFELGIAGLLLSVAIFAFAVRTVVKVFKSPIALGGLGALALFACFRIMWDLFFSPLSDTRFWPAYIVAISAALTLERKSG
jgi:hypothetical protein